MELKANPCPKCGNQKVSVRGIFMGSDGKGCARVKCKQCGFTGPFAETAEEAVKVWNILIIEVFERMNPHHEKEGDAMKKHEPCPVCGKANMEVKQMTLSKKKSFVESESSAPCVGSAVGLALNAATRTMRCGIGTKQSSKFTEKTSQRKNRLEYRKMWL